jgi:flagellar protein FliS
MLMTQQSTAAQYQSMQLATADRGRLLLLMFEGGMRFLTQAEAALGEDRTDQFVERLGRAQAVIAELLHTLDHKAGGELAAQLERLYRFMLEHLVEANLRKSARHLADVRRVLSIIAGAYAEILAHGLPKAAQDAA